MNSETILIATDLNEDRQRILNAAGLLRALRPRRVHLLHVLPREIPAVPLSGTGAAILPPPVSSGPSDSPAGDEISGEVVEKMEALVSGMASEVAIETEMRHGHPATVICEAAASLHAGLVVVASHGHGLVRRLLLGSTAQYVANHAPCNVLILRPEPAMAPEMARTVSADDSALNPLPVAAGCVA